MIENPEVEQALSKSNSQVSFKSFGPSDEAAVSEEEYEVMRVPKRDCLSVIPPFCIEKLYEKKEIMYKTIELINFKKPHNYQSHEGSLMMQNAFNKVRDFVLCLKNTICHPDSNVLNNQYDYNRVTEWLKKSQNIADRFRRAGLFNDKQVQNIQDLGREIVRKLQPNDHPVQENTKIESPKQETDFDYTPLEKDFRERLRKTSINRESSKSLLELLAFLDRTLRLIPDLKFFCYGPAINGLTTQNQIQFSIDVQDSQKRSGIEILKLICRKLQNSDLQLYGLICEERFDRGKSFLQLMKSVLTLTPTNSRKWKPGTRIFFTVGNREKYLESLLLQIYGSISPQFNEISIVLKKWVSDLSCCNKKNVKWITMIFMLVHYMQGRKLLPKMQKEELVKAFLESKQTNFQEKMCEKYLQKIENEEGCFRMIKIQEAVQMFGDFDRCSSGKLMLDFFEFCRHHSGTIKVLDDDQPLDVFKHHFIVQHIFSPTSQNTYMSLISTNVTPSSLDYALGEQLFQMEKILKNQFHLGIREMSRLKRKIIIEIDENHNEIRTILSVKKDLQQLQKTDCSITKIRCFHSFMKVLNKAPSDPDVCNQCEYNMREIEQLHQERGIFTQEQVSQLRAKFDSLHQTPKLTLAQQIDDIYLDNKPDTAFIQRIQSTLSSFLNTLLLSKSFQEKYCGYHIMKYGSSVNGLCSRHHSDLDLTIITQSQDPEIVLRDVITVLNKYGDKRYQIDMKFPRKDRAGWIVKFRDNETHTEIDLMVNKTSEVLNSLLILQYSQIDERFVRVTHFLKVWNKQFQFQTRFNNFTLYLMLIGYMQHEKLLPNLQALAQNGKIRRILKHKIPNQQNIDLEEEQNTHYLTKEQFNDILAKTVPFQKVEKSAAEILKGFFIFYGFKFDTSLNTVDISQSLFQEDVSDQHLTLDPFFLGKSILDRQCLENHIICSISSDKVKDYVMWAFLDKKPTYMVMDPFNRTYTPAKNVKGDMYQKAFARAAQQIIKQGVLEF